MPEQLSGLTPQITLSGPQLAPGGFSGAPAGGGLAGTGAGQGAGTPFGLPGGPGLDLLSALLGGGGEAGSAIDLGGLTSGLGAGSFGQQGGITAGSVGQQGGGGAGFGRPAGGISAGQTGQQGPAAGSVDPFSVLAKILGLARTGIGLLGTQQTPTASPTGETTPTAPGISPTGEQIGLEGLGTGAPPQLSGIQASPPTGQPTTDLSLSPAGAGTQQLAEALTPEAYAQIAPLLQQAGISPQQFLSAFGGTTMTPEQIQQVLGGQEAALASQGGQSLAGTPAGTPQANLSGALQGGLGAGTGLLNIVRALQGGGNAAGAIPGGIQSIQGLAKLLTSFPDLMKSLSESSPTLAQGIGLLGGGGVPASFLGPELGGAVTAGGLAGTGLGLFGGLVGDKGLSEAGNILGSVSQIPALTAAAAGATIGEAAPAIAAAVPALSSVSAAAIPAVGAAIAMLTALATDLASNQPGLQVAVDTLAAPDLIASQIAQRVIDPALHPSEAWMTFPGRVGATAGQESRDLSALIQGLPYVQSQQELQNLVNAFRGQVGQQVGGYGQGAGPLEIPSLPEVGPRTHGYNTGGMVTNFGAITPGLNQAIQALNPLLPATYTGPAGDNPLMRDFYQFLNPRGTGDYAGAAPIEVFTNEPGIDFAAVNAQTPYSGRMYFQGGPEYTPATAEGYIPQTLQYGDPGYNYAAAGFPAPGQTFGTPSAAWQQLLAGGVPRPGPAPAPAPAPALNIPPQILAALTQPTAARPGMGAPPVAGGGNGSDLFSDPLLAAYFASLRGS